MALVDTYKWGSLYVDAVNVESWLEDQGELDKGVRKDVLELLKESNVDFQFDEDWNDGSMYRVDGQETPLVLLGTFGGYPGEPLDEANSQAAKEWAEDRDYIYCFSSWFGGCEMVSLYLNMDDCTLEEAEEAIELVEGYSEYPVLDEDLWSELQYKAWDEMLDEMTADSENERDIEFTESQREYIREAASNFYGYWDEAYFPETEWEQIIAEALDTEGVTVQLHQSEQLF